MNCYTAAQPLEAKVVLLGASGVGKTTLLNRCLQELTGRHDKDDNAPIDSSGPTIGAVFANVTVPVEGSSTDEQDDNGNGNAMQWAKLQVWDTAGGERYRSLTPLYYRNASAALLVFDISSWESYKQLTYWTEQLRMHCKGEQQQQLFIICNKIDIGEESREVSEKLAADFAQTIGAKFYSSSATSGQGVLQLITSVAAALIAAATIEQQQQQQQQPNGLLKNPQQQQRRNGSRSVTIATPNSQLRQRDSANSRSSCC